MNTTNYYDLFGIKSPYPRFKGTPDLKEVMHGWSGGHVFFQEIVEKINPDTIIELGSFLGQSAINMATTTKKLNLGTKMLCVDTWLGSWEHWRDDKCNCLKFYNYFENGISAMYDQFVINMIVNGVDDVVVPIPNTTANAFEIFKWKGVTADLIYIDGSHLEDDVTADIKMYLQLLSARGLLIGDDYTSWEGVKTAVNKAASELNLELTLYYNYYWSLTKKE